MPILCFLLPLKAIGSRKQAKQLSGCPYHSDVWKSLLSTHHGKSQGTERGVLNFKQLTNQYELSWFAHYHISLQFGSWLNYRANHTNTACAHLYPSFGTSDTTGLFGHKPPGIPGGQQLCRDQIFLITWLLHYLKGRHTDFQPRNTYTGCMHMQNS